MNEATESAERAIKMTIDAMTKFRAYMVLNNRDAAMAQRQVALDALDAYFDHVAMALTHE